MKPVRGWPALWRGDLPPERRMALAAAAVLFLLIGGMAWYQMRPAPDAWPAPDAVGSADPAGFPEVTDSVDAAAAGSRSGSALRAGTGAASAAGDPRLTAGAGEAVADEPAEEAVAFSWPLSGRPRVVMAFGAVDGSLGDYRLSDGVALEATPGQPVTAAAAGTVALVEEHPVDGITVVLDHGGGKRSRYAGLAEAAVTEGQAVASGERLGRIGLPSPLRSDLGPHLLFGLMVDEEPVDPLPYLEE
ncbi:M23 family metallopeptidase [Symbiobacterium thermophilum]|uniref:Putative peptidase n=1 Tax=Symbiobacterium thermophilum (strain DSM 24528 / JCM 14929 / IAM 14863 / T) TaxID=292459 RepID=Q67TA6_SYMTH|nr:M23 family metallopeptidase [Symbiobacterium thermophilum]BAD39087.1 putative peptidase [Symbiobacterium thermophilum IAM 14863]